MRSFCIFFNGNDVRQVSMLICFGITYSDPNVCYICGEGELNLEPPVYYCRGPCREKIRRNARFYCNDAKTHYWCSNCCRQGANPGNVSAVLRSILNFSYSTEINSLLKAV